MSRLVDISPFEKCRIVLHPGDSGFSVKDLPTVDAEPVVHGHWIKTKSKSGVDFTCSACGYTFTDGDPEYECDYSGCPMCRAKMDEVSE